MIIVIIRRTIWDIQTAITLFTKQCKCWVITAVGNTLFCHGIWYQKPSHLRSHNPTQAKVAEASDGMKDSEGMGYTLAASLCEPYCLSGERWVPRLAPETTTTQHHVGPFPLHVDPLSQVDLGCEHPILVLVPDVPKVAQVVDASNKPQSVMVMAQWLQWVTDPGHLGTLGLLVVWYIWVQKPVPNSNKNMLLRDLWTIENSYWLIGHTGKSKSS